MPYTHYYIDHTGYIHGPTDGAQFYIRDKYIYGPRNSGKHYLADPGAPPNAARYIYGPKRNGEFYVAPDDSGQTAGHIYGPDALLPWLDPEA